MRKGNSPRMEEEPRRPLWAAARGAVSVGRVAGNGMADLGEMHADLMGAPGDEVDLEEGPAGQAFADRPSTPHRQPRRLSPEAEAEIIAWRAKLEAGPLVIASVLERPPSTVGKVLRKPIIETSEEEYDSMFDINAKVFERGYQWT